MVGIDQYRLDDFLLVNELLVFNYSFDLKGLIDNGSLVSYLVAVEVEPVLHQLNGLELNAIFVAIKSCGCKADNLEILGFSVLPELCHLIEHKGIRLIVE